MLPKLVFSGVSFFKFMAITQNAKLSGQGPNANNLSMIKICVKAESFESRSVAPDRLQRHVLYQTLSIFGQDIKANT